MNFVDVASTIMIRQGTDGFSRGYMFEGVLKGELTLSFVALHKEDIGVSNPVLEWIYTWSRHRRSKVELMTPGAV